MADEVVFEHRAVHFEFTQLRRARAFGRPGGEALARDGRFELFPRFALVGSFEADVFDFARRQAVGGPGVGLQPFREHECGFLDVGLGNAARRQRGALGDRDVHVQTSRGAGGVAVREHTQFRVEGERAASHERGLFVEHRRHRRFRLFGYVV